MEVTRLIQVGEPAPDFELKDQDGTLHKLSDYRGHRLLLSFHPLAWTNVCAKQMKALEDHHGRFAALNTVPLGISIDTTPSKHAWAKSLDIEKTRLLSDFWPHGGYAKELGLFREEEGSSKRANMIIDEAGKVAWLKVYGIPQLPDLEEVFAALAGHA